LITLLRKIPLLGSSILLLILIGSKWYMWQPIVTELQAGSFESLVVLLTILCQAVFLRYIVKSNRLLVNNHFIIVFLYLFFSIQSYSELIYSSNLIIPFLLLAILQLAIRLYNHDSSINSLMGIGSLLGIGVVIDHAFIVFLPLALIALTYFVLLDFRKSLIVFYYLFLVLLIGIGLLYANDQLELSGLRVGINGLQLEALVNQPLVASFIWANTSMAFVFFTIGSRFLSVRSVKIRNVHRIFSLCLPFTLLFYLFSRNINWVDAGIFAIPVSAICAYYFENAKRAWFYESMFIVVLFIQFFSSWYYAV
jgi:hypothetical protein